MDQVHDWKSFMHVLLYYHVYESLSSISVASFYWAPPGIDVLYVKTC